MVNSVAGGGVRGTCLLVNSPPKVFVELLRSAQSEAKKRSSKRR